MVGNPGCGSKPEGIETWERPAARCGNVATSCLQGWCGWPGALERGTSGDTLHGAAGDRADASIMEWRVEKRLCASSSGLPVVVVRVLLRAHSGELGA